MILEVGKSYRLNNQWRMEVTESPDVDHFIGKVYKVIDGTETFYDGVMHYTRDGQFRGAQDDPKYPLHVSHHWVEPSTSGLRDMDGWDTERFRKAVANSGLFNF